MQKRIAYNTIRFYFDNIQNYYTTTPIQANTLSLSEQQFLLRD